MRLAQSKRSPGRSPPVRTRIPKSWFWGGSIPARPSLGQDGKPVAAGKNQKAE